MNQKSVRTTFVLTLLVMSCAGGKLAPYGSLNDVPTDVPVDLQKKFTISDENKGPPPAPTVQAPTANIVPVASVPLRPASKKKLNAPIPTPTSAAVSETPKFEIPSRRPSPERIRVGEEIKMQLTFFGVLAGELTMEVLPHKVVNSRSVYHLRARAESSSVFSMFYRVDDMIESFYDQEGWFSHRFNLLLDESKQTRSVVELFDSEKKQTFYWLRWNHHKKGKVETKEFFPMTPFPQDSLSAFYYLRSVKIPEVGKTVSFPIVAEGKSWEADLVVMERQVLDTPIGKLKTVKLKVDTRYEGVLQKTGDTYLWLTDDAWKYPVRLEAKVRIGVLVLAINSLIPGEGGELPKPIGVSSSSK